MFTIIPLFIRLPIIVLLIVMNTVLVVLCLLLASFLKWCLPFDALRRVFEQLAVMIAEWWISFNSWMTTHFTRLKIHLNINGCLNPNGNYLVLSNHQSWADIAILQNVLNHKIPFMRFFLKSQLIWVPFLGLAWWALDFPFMKRYTKSQIQKRPELAGSDIAATRKACEKFSGKPVSIMIFPEGTRFTASKQQSQQSPYANLLKPKSGGMAYALDAMGHGLQLIADVSLFYPNGKPSIYDLFANRIKSVFVDVRVRDIPEAIRSGNYENDRAFRVEFQSWLNGLWQDKQQILESHQQQ